MKKVLLAEDDRDLRGLLADVLGGLDIEVMQAYDGQDAKNFLLLETFDLIVSDIQMPHMKGTDLLEWIKEKNSNTPVVLITGYVDLLEGRDPSEIGAVSLLQKPFKSQDLVDLVRLSVA